MHVKLRRRKSTARRPVPRTVASSTSANDARHNESQTAHLLRSGAWSATSYVWDILRTAFSLLKEPLGVLAFLMVAGLLFTYVLGTILSPLCHLPGIASSTFCVDRALDRGTEAGGPKSANFLKLVELQDGFQDILNVNVGTNEIGMKLKQSEMATRDLVTLVRVSDLKSREVLADALVQFVDDAKKTGEGLHKLSAKIDGAVDRITAANDFTMRVLETLAEENAAGSTPAIRWLTSASYPEGLILRAFGEVMDTLAWETHRTLLEASSCMANLERLHERLLTIHEICLREGFALSAAHAELLSELWSMLGGNRHARRKNERHLALLREVGRYRVEALAHVVATRDALQAVAADVEELRARSAAAEIVGERVSPEVLIESIGHGVQRLREGRQKASERQEMLVKRLLATSSDAYTLTIDDT